MVATSCATGKPVYFDTPTDFDDLLLKCKASCSLPFVCRTVTVEGVPMLDGGISDPLPVERAKEDGYAKRVVVLTRNLGYRKNFPAFRPLSIQNFLNCVRLFQLKMCGTTGNWRISRNSKGLGR